MVNILNTRKNNYGVNDNVMDISDIEDRTQNINPDQTDNTSTTINNQLNVSSLTADGEVNLFGQVTVASGGSLTTEQTLFTLDQELITKKYCDDNIGGGSTGENKEIYDFSGKNESDYLSTLTGNSVGIENMLFHGEFVTVKSSVSMSAGRVVSFNSSTDNANEYEIDFCNGNSGEQNSSSQALGVTLDDVIAGGYTRVATKGICSVLVGSTTTAQRGCMVTLGGSASSFQGRIVCTSRTSNEPSIGISMTYGSKSANDPIVVYLQTTFESY